MLPIIDAMKGKQIDVVKTEVSPRFFESFDEIVRLHWRDLGLNNNPVSRKSWKDATKLHFRSAVTPGGFDMIDPQFDRAPNGGFQVGLIVGGNFVRRNILPFVLVAHPSAAKDGHLQFCLPKP